MDNQARIFFPVAFLTGLLLATFLWLATTKMVIPQPVQAAQFSDGNNSNPAEDVASNIKKIGSQGSKPANAECQVSPEFPPKILKWCGLITKHAIQRGLEPDLLAALILQESGGNPNAYSKSGAVGLMQVMPNDGIAASFTCTNGPCFKNRPSISELKDPEFNVAYGTKMLAGLSKKYGNIREALKYYGPADVGYYYSDIVLSIYKRYQQ
jgi:soluble lytic murein transglycosylase-like protein